LAGTGLLFGERPAVAGAQKNGMSPGEAVQAAAEVFENYGGFIRAVIRTQVRNRSEEEDLYQEFFLALLRTPMPLDVENVKGYLYRAISNHIVNAVRASKCQHRRMKKYAKKFRIHVYIQPATSALLDTEEYDASIIRCLEHLHEREAQAFVLRYRDHRSIGEIAATMGVTARTVSRYLSGSIRKLRRRLAAQ
jgi:RNA polymerase sigma factor (sigma-70 family)